MAWRGFSTKKSAAIRSGPYSAPYKRLSEFAAPAAPIPAVCKRNSSSSSKLHAQPLLTSGLALHKKFGQHLLKNPAVLEKMIRAADLRSSDTVLEIGPVLMFQKEFGERLMAQPGDKNYCRLAVNVSLFCTVQRVCKVEAKHFSPPPKVDSVVVKIVPRPKLFQLDFKEWDGLMRICFGRKNRTLHALFRRSSVISMLESNYKTWCSLNEEIPTSTPFREYCLSVLEETNLKERRSISIGIDTFFGLLLAFNKKGIHFVNVASLSPSAATGIVDGDSARKADNESGVSQLAGIDEYFFYDDDSDKQRMDDDEE